MRLNCPDCNAILSHEDINIDRGIGSCRDCDSVFNLHDFGIGKDGYRKRKLTMVSDKIDVYQDGMDFIVERRWSLNRGLLVSIGFFALFWNSLTWMFAFKMISEILEKGAFPKGGFILFTHVPVGLVMLYLFLAFLVNKTQMRVGFNTIKLWHGPVPWPGKFAMDRTQVENFYCQQYSMYQKNKQPVWGFKVVLKDKNGQERDCFRGITDYNVALSIEQELERHLGIKDKSQVGEHVDFAS